jgi:hypothetical protein
MDSSFIGVTAPGSKLAFKAFSQVIFSALSKKENDKKQSASI